MTVNDRPEKASFKLNVQDRVMVTLPDEEPVDILPEDIPLDILYEDPELLVVNKPKGMVVHPSAGHSSGTLVNALLYHCSGQLSGINGVQRPGIVHRIDKDTTGALVVCKTDLAHQSLAAQLKEHSITRRYRAVVHHNIREDEGTVDAPIGRHPVDRKKMAVNYRNGKRAVTHYRVLERFGDYTYIECRLETAGRIRSGCTCPISVIRCWGMRFTGRQNVLSTPGAVSARHGFGIPSSGHREYLEFTAPLPEYFEQLLRKL